MPARNSCVIDVSVMMPKRIMGIDGGMMMPNAPLAQIRPIENDREYPLDMSAENITVPTDSMVTMLEPEIAAKIAQLNTVATLIPPGMGAVRAIMIRMRRLAMLPRVITAPASKNMGIASNISLSRAAQTSWIMYSNLLSASTT